LVVWQAVVVVPLLPVSHVLGEQLLAWPLPVPLSSVDRQAF
jgi:hypothetical protein